MKISFVVPGRNNLKYFKWSYDSIKKHQGSHDITICFADDFSNDGTWDWIKEKQKIDPKLKAIRNNGPTRLGHCILYDQIVEELVTDDIFMIWHCDMYLCPNAIDYIEKYIQPKTIVSLTRIEPLLHPGGKEKIQIDFGVEPELFDENKFLTWFNTTKEERKEKITEGIFAPWAIYKKDFQSIGGHDEGYQPQSKEDSSIFNRFQLNGYKFIQTWDGCVAHMTCRGSRFNPFLTIVGKESDEWLKQNNRSTRNFIRMWGHFVKHDEYMKPIIPHKYDVGFIITNCNDNFLSTLEPWCQKIYIDNFGIAKSYIKKEQPNTKFNLTDKIKNITDEKTNNIIVKFDCNKLTNNNFQIIQNLSEIITDSGEVGNFKLDIFDVEIKSLQYYENDLIVCKNTGWRRPIEET
jgi:glycosyltransferase involved in cell wall biosynthesis